MQLIRLNETTASLIEVQFTSVSSTNLQTRILGSTLANTSIVVYSKRGGTGPAVALTSDASTWTATDDTSAPGVRCYKPLAAEIVLGVQTLIFTGTNMEPREVPIMVVSDDPYRPVYYGTVVAGTLTTSAFTTDRTETTTDAWKDALVEFLSGPNVGAVKPIGAYDGTTKKITLKTGYVLPASPTAGDKFRIVTR